jgi:8-oxo-dGTP pyrophosphatase MutT (NUDIX family)
MVSDEVDKSIVQTCLREMEEEIGIQPSAATVLGVLRCNWGEVCFL